MQDPRQQFSPGTILPYGSITLSKEDIIAFASEYDPAPFHIDEEAAKRSLLGNLSASGFHTCSLTMRMICEAYLLDTPSQGSPGVENLQWHAPVHPGDTLRGQTTVLYSRISNKRPDLMIANLKHETFNQKDILVLTMTNALFLKLPGEES